jgi:alpha-tubulin suppressor-like RCC1 family protein
MRNVIQNNLWGSRQRALALASLSILTFSIMEACSDDDSNPPASDQSTTDASTKNDATPGSDSAGGADSTTGTDAGKEDVTAQDAAADAPDDVPDSAPFCNVSPCATQIDVGYEHACALLSDKTVRCWGSNAQGQVSAHLPDGGNDITPQILPVPVEGLTDVKHVSVGIFHSCALKNDGTVWCWGSNGDLQLGLPDAATPSFTPVQVQGWAGPIAELEVGGYRTCARLQSGAVQCLGDNDQGQLGRGDAGGTSGTIGDIVGVTNASDIEVGLRHTCIIQDGGVYCVGRNQQGELGRGDAGPLVNDPNVGPVPGLTSVHALGRMTGHHACAILDDESLRCWGDNTNSQLEDAGNPQKTPFAFSGIANVAEVTGGYFTMCARITDGGLYCWGANGAGQTGSDAASPVKMPTFVQGLGKVIQVSGSYDPYACALVEGGSVYCWGSNAFGRLGRGQDGGALVSGATPGLVTF